LRCVRKRGAIAVLVCLALPVPAASASPYADILHVYQTQGSIPPCRFSSPELAAALKGIDTYGQQYFADFSDAVQTALAARAAGSCARGVHPALSSEAAPQAPLPASPTSATDAGPPLPILLLAALTFLIVLVAGVGALARRQGWEPAWAAAWRHACAEAGYRVAGGLADLADWWQDGRR
jgi:hypothetical protein